MRLVNGGLDMLSVKDNGSGVPRSALAACTKRHFTSKIACFEDLLGVTSYGFRGEALNSLCAVAEKFSIVTKTAEDAHAVRVTYDVRGRALIKTSGSKIPTLRHAERNAVTAVVNNYPSISFELQCPELMSDGRRYTTCT